MTLKDLKKEVEKDYMESVVFMRENFINFRNDMEGIEREHYRDLCETLALIYMKEHGYNNIPDIGYIFGFQFDEVAEEYIVDDRIR